MTEIINSTHADLPQIFELFDQSIRYQQRKGFPVWKNYDQNVIVKDIEHKHHFKVLVDSKTAMVFSIRYSDKLIWRERDQDDAIYLHRIVVNPEFKGRKLFGDIFNWAIEQARMRMLHYVRMDTWATNANIIEYYKSFGFVFVENYTTPDSEELPVHNRNLALALLEYKLTRTISR